MKTKFAEYGCCAGDRIDLSRDGWNIVARLEMDWDASPSDYSEADIRAWRNGMWEYRSLVLSIGIGDHILDNNAASINAIACGPDCAEHLNDLAEKLVPDAIARAIGVQHHEH